MTSSKSFELRAAFVRAQNYLNEMCILTGDPEHYDNVNKYVEALQARNKELILLLDSYKQKEAEELGRASDSKTSFALGIIIGCILSSIIYTGILG